MVVFFGGVVYNKMDKAYCGVREPDSDTLQEL